MRRKACFGLSPISTLAGIPAETRLPLRRYHLFHLGKEDFIIRVCAPARFPLGLIDTFDTAISCSRNAIDFKGNRSTHCLAATLLYFWWLRRPWGTKGEATVKYVAPGQRRRASSMTMRIRVMIAALSIAASCAAVGQSGPSPVPAASEVVGRMFKQDMQREAASGGYTGLRQYTLENPRFGKHASMEVRVACDADGTEHFQIVSENGWKSGNDRVLRRMLEEESETSRPPEQPKIRISSDNYTFQMIGTDLLDGRPAYVIGVFPKRRDELLFRGRIWVDTSDYALARAQGQIANNPSFWVRSINFTWESRKRDGYWFPVSTTGISEVRLLGRIEVNVRYLNYSPSLRRANEDGHPVLAEVGDGKR